MRVLRILGRTLIGLAALVAITLTGIYIETARRLEVAPWTPTAPLQQGDIAEGARLAKVMGCRGCHTETLRGGDFVEEPHVFKLVAPNLTQARARYDDAAWQRLFRTGAKANGSLAVGMPVKAFQRLTDREVADLVAYVRSVPEVVHPVGRAAERDQGVGVTASGIERAPEEARLERSDLTGTLRATHDELPPRSAVRLDD